jgi:hypothetical protein
MRTEIQHEFTPATVRFTTKIAEAENNRNGCAENAKAIVARYEKAIHEPSELHKRFLQQLAEKYQKIV